MSLFDALTFPPPPPDPDTECRALVALSLVAGVGPGRIAALVGAFGRADTVLTAPAARLAAVPGVGPELARRIRAFDGWDEVEAQIRRAERIGARLVTRWSPSYPRLLAALDDAPAFLWVRGEIDADALAVGVVGTRRATPYGRRAAEAFAFDLAAAGIAVVSGLAYGIDGAAHAAALDAASQGALGTTWAVLGSGVDRVYPGRHGPLADQIVASGGAVISELPMGAAPDAPNFPRRNRLVSGLCRALLVVEAHESGGALLTARLALDQNREVYAVPGPFDAPASAGAHALIARGEARLVTSPAELLADLLGTAAPTSGASSATTAPAGRPVSGLRPRVPTFAPRPPAMPDDLAPAARTLWGALSRDPCALDDLLAAAHLDASTALVTLFDLELRGLVRQFAGRQFALV